MRKKIVKGRRYTDGTREGIVLDARTGRSTLSGFSSETQAALRADDGTVFAAAKAVLEIMYPTTEEAYERQGSADAVSGD
jgi:hypothetical protein